MSEPAPTPTPVQTELPAGTELAIKRERFNEYIRARKEGKKLTPKEWADLTALTAELEQKSPTGDVDYWEMLDGSEAMNPGRPGRISAATRLVRLETIADWLEEGKKLGWMVANAQKRWGVGYHSVRRYRIDALNLVAKRAEKSRATYLGVTMARIDVLYNMGRSTNDPGPVKDSIDQLVKVMGLAAPVTQKMEVSGPGGAPLAYFDLPPKKMPDDTA